MADDPYQVLGVARDADPAAVRTAYRKLAKRHHPDLNPGDAAAEATFKKVSAAHAILSDPEARGKFDRGEIDGAGDPRAPEPPRYRDFADGGPGGWQTSGHPAGGWTAAEWGDIFGDMFADRAGRAGDHAAGAAPRRGRDERYTLAVSFLDAVRGATTRLTLPDGRTLDVRVPAGIDEGGVLRLRGKGGHGWNGGPDGDALIAVQVGAHPHYRRDGRDILLDLPVTLREAVLGARVPVPTPGGTVNLAIPPGSESGRQLRLRGRGVAETPAAPAGDLYVTLRIAATEADPALAEFLRGWTPAEPADVRRDLGSDPA